MSLRAIFPTLALAGLGLACGYLFTLYQDPTFQILLESWGLC